MLNTAWLQLLLVRELASFEAELMLFPEEAQLWATVPGIANSAGNLALHVSGNLQYYIGSVLGGTGYIRNRPLECSARSVPRPEVVAELQRAGNVVSAVLPILTQASLSVEYPDVLGGPRIPTGLFLMHLCGHLAHHLGQAGYLRRVLTGDSRSAGALPLAALSSVPRSAA